MSQHDPMAPSIMRVLSTGDSTVAQISDLTGLPSDLVRSTLNRLKRQGKVEIVGYTSATNVAGKPVGGPRAKVWGSKP